MRKEAMDLAKRQWENPALEAMEVSNTGKEGVEPPQ